MGVAVYDVFYAVVYALLGMGNCSQEIQRMLVMAIYKLSNAQLATILMQLCVERNVLCGWVNMKLVFSFLILSQQKNFKSLFSAFAQQQTLSMAVIPT